MLLRLKRVRVLLLPDSGDVEMGRRYANTDESVHTLPVTVDLKTIYLSCAHLSTLASSDVGDHFASELFANPHLRACA